MVIGGPFPAPAPAPAPRLPSSTGLLPWGEDSRRVRVQEGLHVDLGAERTWARIIDGLRSARLSAGISQNALAAGLPVRGRAISEWETYAVEPTLNNLILAADELQRCLALIDVNGHLVVGSKRQRPGEDWVVFQRRRLATPLRNRRLALGWNQGKLGVRVGVSRDSIQRWELVRVPPRPIAHVVWAQQLGYTLVLVPRI